MNILLTQRASTAFSMRLAVTFTLAAVMPCVLALLPGRANAASTSVKVYVAYADNEDTPAFWPDPWLGSTNTIFLGDSGPSYDTGAILIRNTGTSDVVLGPGATVDGFANGASFTIWDSLIGTGVTIHSGQNLILAETAYRNFDTSDQPQSATHTANQPVIHLTLNGNNRSFTDTAQILNTGGYDARLALGRNESVQWRPIATTGIDDPGGTPVVPTSVATYHNDGGRTGQNTSETTLAPANVNTTTFGLLFAQQLDEAVATQPLVMANVHIPGVGVRNVVFVGTENNTLYAFDADHNTGANGGLLWKVNLGTPIPSSDIPRNCGSVAGLIGITGTPVINPKTGTLYVVAATKENGAYFCRLHALDMRTGAEKTSLGSPALIQATYPGSGDGSVNGVIPFDPRLQFQRSALALVNGVVYITFAAHCDITPYHGWIFGFKAGALQQSPSVWVTTPNGKTDPSGYPVAGGGVWQAGGAPATDGKSLFFSTGNGTFDADPSLGGGIDYGDSVVRLTPGTSGLALKDFFTPYNQNDLNVNDLDLGSGGCIALPASVGSAAHPQLLVCCGKTGTIYLLDRTNLGHFNTGGSDSQIVQSVPNAVGGVWGNPAYFNNTVYYGGVGDALKAFSISNAQLSTTPTSQTASTFNYPGVIPSVSASGTAKGIVWMAESGNSGAVLHAFDATNLATELYNSTQAGGRDTIGYLSTFMPPTIANGKVYVATWAGLNVFGSGVWTAAPQISPAGGFYTNSVSVSIGDTTPGATIFYTTDGSAPTTSSTVYIGPFTLTNCAPVRAIAVSPMARTSGVGETDYVVGIPPANGTGLTGTYYAGLNFTGSTYTEIDPTIDFNWNGGSPAPGIPGTNWSARWLGTIEPQCNTTYAFYTYSDDGIRVWVNGQEIINDWTYHAPTWDSGTITLTAGQQYPIKIEYFQGTGGSLLQLYWAPDYLDAQIVPQTQLFPGKSIPPK